MWYHYFIPSFPIFCCYIKERIETNYKIRGIFKWHSNTYIEVFCENSTEFYIRPRRLTRDVEFQTFRYRSTCPEVFCKNDVHRNFAKFTGKQLRHSLFLNIVAGLICNFIKKKWLRHRCFLANFKKFPSASFLTEHTRWLLLSTVYNNMSKIVWNFPIFVTRMELKKDC